MRIALPWPGGLAGATPDNPYSRRIARLKLILPAVGLGLLLTVAAWPRLAPLFERLRFAWPAIDLREARELRMLNPRYLGTDRMNHPFVVTAAVGRQVPDRQDLMALEQPRADMQTRGGATIVLNSDSGVYQGQSQLLDLFGNVTLVHQNGSRFVTESAHLDLAANGATGHQAVEGHGPSGDVAGEGFEISDKGDIIVVTGRSQLTARSATGGTKPSATPPALPDAVIATAAQAEAQLKAMPVAARSSAALPHSAVAHPPRASADKGGAQTKPPANKSAVRKPG